MNTNTLPKYRVIDSPSSHETAPYEEDFNAVQLLSEMPAVAVRDWSGAWCGYVGLTKSHPLYDLGYVDNYDKMPHPHGDLTYAWHNAKFDACVGLPNAHLWWLGFDCAHQGDFTPALPCADGTYRNIDYVVSELLDMIDFLTQARPSGRAL